MLVGLMVMSTSTFVFANPEKGNKPEKPVKPTIEEKQQKEEKPEKPVKEEKPEGTEEEKEEEKPEAEEKVIFGGEEEATNRKDEMKKERANNKKEKELEEKLKALEEADEEGNEEAVENVKKEIQAVKKEAMKIRNELKKKMKSYYSGEELESIEALKAELEGKFDELKVLGVDSILSNSAAFKFDAPPVIKDGRTLIPVRAITEGFKADVQWDGEERKVTIVKGDTTIELWLGNQTVIVNGEEVVLDTQPEIISDRTFVPLRFIAETLNLNVEWNEEDETIELIDEEDMTDETAPAEGETMPAEGETTPAEGETTPAEGETTPAEGETTPAE